jgi:hypothetical protein
LESVLKAVSAQPKKLPTSPGIVITDDVFFGVIVFANDGQLLHVEAVSLKLPHGGLSFLMVGVHGNYEVIFSHD